MAESTRHPDLLGLDSLRAADDSDPTVAAHVRECPQCQRTLVDLTAVAADLKAQHGPALEAAAERDAAIILRAKTEAARVRRATRWDWRRTAARPSTWAAAAAAVLGIASVLFIGRRPERIAREELHRAAAVPATGALVVADRDQDGRVTVLDAFALARQLERKSDAADVNGDQRIDGKDVDTVLAMAVSIGGA